MLISQEEIADQHAKFKAEEDELMRAIEEQEKENAKLKKDLKAWLSKCQHVKHMALAKPLNKQ